MLYAGVTVLASVLRLLLARRAFSRFRVVTQHAGPLLHSFTRLLRLAALAAWAVVVLNEFRIYRPIRDAVAGVLTHELRFGQISLTLGGVLLFLFSVWLAFWAAKTVRADPAGRSAAEDVAAARRRQQHLLADLLRGGDRSACSWRSRPRASR